LKEVLIILSKSLSEYYSVFPFFIAVYGPLPNTSPLSISEDAYAVIFTLRQLSYHIGILSTFDDYFY